MNITNVTVTKVAEESTENADYQLEYSIVNDALTRVHASIRKKDTDGSGNAPQIGIIYMEQGVISCNIPMGEPLAPLFHDFDTMIDEIKRVTYKMHKIIWNCQSKTAFTCRPFCRHPGQLQGLQPQKRDSAQDRHSGRGAQSHRSSRECRGQAHRMGCGEGETACRGVLGGRDGVSPESLRTHLGRGASGRYVGYRVAHLRFHSGEVNHPFFLPLLF